MLPASVVEPGSFEGSSGSARDTAGITGGVRAPEFPGYADAAAEASRAELRRIGRAGGAAEAQLRADLLAQSSIGYAPVRLPPGPQESLRARVFSDENVLYLARFFGRQGFALTPPRVRELVAAFYNQSGVWHRSVNPLKAFNTAFAVWVQGTFEFFEFRQAPNDAGDAGRYERDIAPYGFRAGEAAAGGSVVDEYGPSLAIAETEFGRQLRPPGLENLNDDLPVRYGQLPDAPVGAPPFAGVSAGGRFFRYPRPPRWQDTAPVLRTVERRIGDTLGNAPIGLVSPIRGLPMDALVRAPNRRAYAPPVVQPAAARRHFDTSQTPAVAVQFALAGRGAAAGAAGASRVSGFPKRS